MTFGLMIFVFYSIASSLAGTVPLRFSSDKGTISLRLFCTPGQLEVWFCLDFESDVVRLWDGELVDAMLGKHYGMSLTCQTAPNEASDAVITIPVRLEFGEDGTICSGSLPLGRTSRLWTYVPAIYFDKANATFMHGAEAAVTEQKVRTANDWLIVYPLQTSVNASVATFSYRGQPATSSPVSAELFTTAKTGLATELWAAYGYGKTLELRSLQGPGVAVIPLDAGAVYYANNNSLGTELMKRCSVYLRSAEVFAMKCGLPSVRPVTRNLIVAFCLALYSVVTIAFVPLLLHSFTRDVTIASVALILARFDPAAVCSVTTTSWTLVAIIRFSCFVLACAGWSAFRDSFAAYTAISATGYCLSALPFYCDSGIAVLVELCRITAASGPLFSCDNRSTHRVLRVAIILWLFFIISVAFNFFRTCVMTVTRRPVLLFAIALLLSCSPICVSSGSVLLRAWAIRNPNLLKKKIFNVLGYDSAQDDVDMIALNAVSNGHLNELRS